MCCNFGKTMESWTPAQRAAGADAATNLATAVEQLRIAEAKMREAGLDEEGEGLGFMSEAMVMVTDALLERVPAPTPDAVPPAPTDADTDIPH